MNKIVKIHHVRPIIKADDPLIEKIIKTNLKEFHLDIPGTVYFDPEVEHLSEYYNSLRDKRRYFIAVDNEENVIGGVGVAEFPGFEDCAELQKIYLINEARGNGMGKHLMKVAEEFARKAGYKRMYLETHTNLKTAIRMYEKIGFQQINRPETVLHSTMNRFYVKKL